MFEDLDDAVGRLEEVLIRLVEGEAMDSELETEIERLRAAVPELKAAREAERLWEVATTVPVLLGHRLRSLRVAAQWTQDQVAEAMTEMGFAWHRVTVSQTEAGVRRRATLEELFALSALFARPLVEFLMVPSTTAIELNASLQLDGAVAHELVLGRRGQVGDGGRRWAAARRACSGVENRPALESPIWRKS